MAKKKSAAVYDPGPGQPVAIRTSPALKEMAAKVYQANTDCRQYVDALQAEILAHQRQTGILRSRMQGMDDTERRRRINEDRVVACQVQTLMTLKAEVYKAVSQHPVYMTMLGVPGINAVLLCKLIGLGRMDGPICHKCGSVLHEHTDQVLCWPCRKFVAPELVGQKCDSKVPKERRRPGSKSDTCDRPYTRSHTLYRCSECGELQHWFRTFSKYRVYCGICPGRDKNKKGQPSCFNQRLKVYNHQVFDCLAKAKGTAFRQRKKGLVGSREGNLPPRFYQEIYQTWRNTYAHRHGVGATGEGWLKRRGLWVPDIGGYHPDQYHDVVSEKTGRTLHVPLYLDSRQHLMAKRKLLDVFLYHFWQQWNIICGWPHAPLYVHEKLGHHMTYDFAEFASSSMAALKDATELQSTRLAGRRADAVLERLRAEMGLDEDEEPRTASKEADTDLSLEQELADWEEEQDGLDV